VPPRAFLRQRVRHARVVFVAAVALALAACGSGRDDRPDATAPAQAGERALSFLAVGDTGEPTFLPALRSGQLAVARAMAYEDARQPVDAVVFLGDNFYPDGLREATLVSQIGAHLVRPYCRFERLDAERSSEVASACALPASERRPRPLHAVLGNHDYGDPASPKLQRERVPLFVPDFRVPDGLVEVRRLGDGVDLVLVDSELLMQGADPTPIRDALRASAGPFRVLALHRPVALANGQQLDPDGGEMKLRDAVRRAVADSGVGVQLTLAGHAHNLQVLVEEPPMPLHVVAGGGSTCRPLAAGDASRRFGRRATGFARVDLVREAGVARLVATVFETPRFPIVEDLRGDAPDVVARFSVDASGRVRDELAGR
jgi:hypothetical protein